MNQLTKYNNNKIIYCQFCRNYYRDFFFQKHLQYCTVYLNYIQKYQRQIQWKPRIISYSHNPDIFLSLLKNKRVIIVGPSITVQKCNLGNFINNFDVVVRLNKSLPVPKKMFEHIGNRTDIIYNSLNTTDYPGENKFNTSFLKRQRVKFLRCPYPPIEPFVSDIKSFYNKNKMYAKSGNSINFGHIDPTYYRKLEYSIKTRPYTGTCAIADLLKSEAKELYVMGIDFYTYKHSFYYRNVSERKLEKLRNNNIHIRKPQIDLIRRFYLLDNRLFVDNILDEILLEKYDKLFHSLKSNIDSGKIFINGNGKFVSNIFGKHNKTSKEIKKNKKICIVGNNNEYDISSKKYKNIDLIIDIYPYRENRIRENGITNVYKNIHELENININKNVLFTQVYKERFDLKFKNNNYIFMNPLFTQYLKSILVRTIFSRGVLSLEIFIILIYSTFFDNIFISNIDPNCNWLEQSGFEKQHYIEERMLFQYLLKRNKIRYM